MHSQVPATETAIPSWLAADELARIDALLDRFDLARYRERILAQASPCIAIALLDPPPVPVPDLPPVPVGASKVGGDPDLPPGFRWPSRDDGDAGFHLQIALADLPPAPWNPFPRSGMAYLFCHDDARAFWDTPGWEMAWWDGDPAALRRVERDVQAQNPMIGGGDFFGFSVARPITFRAGADFPPGTSQDWEWVNEFERDTRDSDPEALTRFFEFRTDAADPGSARDRGSGHGPYFHPIGRLLGHTDSDLRESLTLAARGATDHYADYTWRRAHRAELANEGADWKQLIQLFSSTAIEYMSPCDAAPVYLLARDGGTRPWTPAGPIIGLAAK